MTILKQAATMNNDEIFSLQRFLEPFFPDDNEKIHLRALPPKGVEHTSENNARNITVIRKEFTDNRLLRELHDLNRTRGLYFVPNSGGDTDVKINRFNAVFAERDDLSIEAQHDLLDKSPLPTSIRIETAKSVHAYWLIQGECTEAQWREVQRGLIAHFDSDKSIKNPSRLMRLVEFDHVSGNEKGELIYKPVKVVQCDSERRFKVEQLLEAFPAPSEGSGMNTECQNLSRHQEGSKTISEGERNTTLTSLAGKLRYRGLSEDAIFAALKVENKRLCNRPLDESEVKRIAQSIAKYEPGSAENNSPYRSTPNGLVWMKPTKEGSVPVILTNFPAQIVNDIVEDDGAETQRFLDIQATLNGNLNRFSVPAIEFTTMNWPIKHLGTSAVIYPQQRDHARCAIQVLSKNVEIHSVFTYTGWREVNGENIYLHGSGAISKDGMVRDVSVKLPSDLAKFTLPDPPAGDELIVAIRASLRILDVATRSIMFPLLAAIYRAPLGSSDFSLHISGHTGYGKSELAALAQQHYGSDFNARNLPASWSSTGNAIELQGFKAKDAILVIDDFAPQGRMADAQKLHREADRILRAQGNHAGRQRLTSQAILRPTKPPRCLFISTGEDVPAGQSLRARMLILEVGPTTVNWESLSAAQKDAASGLYSKAMAGYLQWLAHTYEEVQKSLKSQIREIREQATKGGMHKRLPDIVANLAVGLNHFFCFAVDSGALTSEEADKYIAEGWNILGEAAESQAQYQTASDPVRIYFEHLSAAISSGQAHVATINGEVPEPNAQAYGWQMSGGNWQSQGRRIGWVDKDHLYLEPTAALAVVQAIGNQTGESLAIGKTTLHKRLNQRGLIVSKEESRETITIRRKIEGRTIQVLHLNTTALGSPISEKPDILTLEP